MHCQLFFILTLAALVGLTQGQEAKECKDASSRCNVYPKSYCSKYKPYMKKRCAKRCGFCASDCLSSVYGCCRDRKTAADGPGEKGCAIKLCYDVFVDGCPKSKKKGLCKSQSSQTRAVMRETCPFTCGFCKHLAPSKSECLRSQYGCCWDGAYATGPNQKGCRPCADTFGHLCKEFALRQCSNTGAYRTRTFLENHCPKTCGVCSVSGCHDRAGKVKCMRWYYKGYCTKSMWKPYMMDSCAKTCDFCQEKGVLA